MRSAISRARAAALLLPLILATTLPSCEARSTAPITPGSPTPGPIDGVYALTGTFNYADTLTLSTTATFRQWRDTAYYPSGVYTNVLFSASLGDVALTGPAGVLATYRPTLPARVGGYIDDVDSRAQVLSAQVTQELAADPAHPYVLYLDGRFENGVWTGQFTFAMPGGVTEQTWGSFSARR